MKSKWQILRNIIIFISLIIITFIVIFSNHDLGKTISILLSVDLKYVLLAIISMSLYFVFEAYNVKNILNYLGNKISILSSIKYTLCEFFFSGITPAASGGQPMEIYYMKKNGIPASHSTLALLIQICSFQVITIICGIIGAIINFDLLKSDFIWIFIIGLSLNIIAVLTMLIGLFSKKLSKKLVNIFIRLLTVFKYKKIDEIKESLTQALDEYQRSAVFIKNNKIIFIKSMIIVLLQVIVYYLVPYFIYLSFDLSMYSVIDIIFIQAMLFISVSSIPIPGTVGVSESAFLTIYTVVFGSSILPSAMLLNRGINFYLFIIIGFIAVILISLKSNKKAY